MTRITVDAAGGPNVCAFLDTVAVAEISRALLAVSDDGYNVLVGSTPAHPRLFGSYASHPNTLVVVNSAGLKSTAAGRYQFIHPTWVPLQARLGLPDFGPESQDLAAVELLRECKAYSRVVSGDVRNGIMMAAKTWASLPGAGYGQPEHDIDWLADVYFDALRGYA